MATTVHDCGEQPAPDGAASLVASRLSYRYPGTIGREDAGFQLREIDLRLPAGSILLVVGPNGSGKSTLLALLALLRRPSSGQLEMLGRSAWKNRWRLRGRIGYVPQRGRMDPAEDVEHALRLALVLKGCRPGRAAGVARELIELFGLGRVASHRVGQLSGGQLQRLLLAAAVTGDPDLLILDEPLAGLDAAGRKSFLAFLRGLADAGTTVIVASHQRQEVSTVADQVLLLEGGRPVRLLQQVPRARTAGERVGRVDP